jgi:hypothetical protein
MGYLKDKVDIDMFTDSIFDYYKKNTAYMYNLYLKSDSECVSINRSDIVIGGFYFLNYEDPSNWMRYSPIFCIDFRKLGDMIIILGVNFNFIPLEIRVAIFDKFLIEKDFENDYPLSVDFKGMYSELLKYGFEYSIVEYNAIQIRTVHRISLGILNKFLYSSYPLNKYDPNKLMEIWTAKLKNREKRHQEISSAVISDFYEIGSEISGKYEALSGHIKRLQDSLNKFKS